jgi:signal transduction histidine kinase/CheY-like chemotaxis protein/PAS domain-containing protein/HPt (histidine-containing phosphotransfer) domain-containing protein
MRSFIRKTQIIISRYAQILLVLLTFALMVFSSYLFVSNIEHQNLRKKARDAISYTEANIKADMLEPETLLSGISETIRTMIMRGDDADAVYSYIQHINTYMQTNEERRLGGIDAFYGYFDVYGGRFITRDANWIPPEGYELQNRLWYRMAVKANGDIGYTQPYYNIVAEEDTITFARRIFNEANIPLGIVCLNIYLDRVRQHAINTQLTQDGFGFLLSSDMKFIAHPEPSMLGMRLHRGNSGIALLEDELWQKDYISERITTDYQGVKSIVFIEKIYNGWYMGVVTPVHQYYQSTRNLAFALILLGVLLSGLLIPILLRVSADKEEAEKRMQIMFDSTPLGANLWDMSYNHIDCNLESIRLFGLSSKEEYNDLFFDLSPKYQPDGSLSREKIIESINKALDEGYYRFEWMHQKLNGEPIPCEVTLVRTKYKDDFVVVGYTRDLRELKTTIAQMNQSRQSLNILENILNGIDAQIYVAVPHTGEILFVNNYMKNDFKVDDDCIGQLCYKVFLKDMDGICDFCPCHQLDKDPNSTVVWEIHNPILDRIYRNTTRYIEWPDGRTVLIQHSVDVTELIAAKEQAIQANLAKSNFLARVSHEVRTPMNAILGITEIQLQNEKNLPDTQEALGEIYNAGYLLMGIINDILDLSKIEADRMELVPINYDVASLINDAVHLNVMRYDSKPIEFSLQVDENIPVTLFGDELRIRQVLNNLLSNAFKYTDSGEVSLSIAAEHTEQEAQTTLIFRVSDTGQGMTAEQVDKLFDEYTRFNMEANRTTVGTGLGMAITKSLVEMMNGTILVESDPGKGSTFTVRLPQGTVDGSGVLGREVAENLKQFRLEKAAQFKKVPHLTREYMPYGRVLIVDDVYTNLYVARGLLSPYGLSVETAESGFEAIERIKKGLTYDVIFMDHFMPKMDGIETTKIMRELGYTQPIVALTANALAGQAEMFLKNGFDGFISKPIDIRQMNAVLNKLVRDKYPAETIEAARQLKDDLKKYADNGMLPDPTDPELAENFIRDAERSLAILETIHENNYRRTDDMKMFTLNAHAMKSALANIGETASSDLALRLEQAGRNEDIAVIKIGVPPFLTSLRTVIEKIKTKNKSREISDTDWDDIRKAYLREKLLVIQAACASYEEKTANTTLTELRQEAWPPSVKELLAAIAERLLHSEFEEAEALAEDYIQKQAG